MKDVYEVIDVTDDESYYPLGIFDSLQESKQSITDYFAEHNTPPMSGFTCPETPLVELVIRERPAGRLSSDEKRVATVRFREYYDEASDAYLWRESPDHATTA